LDPIVLDDEDEDEDEQRRGTPALEKRPVAASDVSPRANKKAREEGQQLEEHIALLRSRVLDLERENATLNATLEEHFIGTEGYETIHIENVKLLEENKQLTNEIAELGRRIGDLMAERNINAVTIEKQGKELEVSKEEVAKLSTIECCSQVRKSRLRYIISPSF
jgi:predicted RNase H-like nuclease (RuvC/YqgF family)